MVSCPCAGAEGMHALLLCYVMPCLPATQVCSGDAQLVPLPFPLAPTLQFPMAPPLA